MQIVATCFVSMEGEETLTINYILCGIHRPKDICNLPFFATLINKFNLSCYSNLKCDLKENARLNKNLHVMSIRTVAEEGGDSLLLVARHVSLEFKCRLSKFCITTSFTTTSVGTRGEILG